MTTPIETAKALAPVVGAVAAVVAETPVLAGVIVGGVLVLGAVALGAYLANSASRYGRPLDPRSAP